MDMTVSGISVKHDNVEYDDYTLVELFRKAQKDIKKRRKFLKSKQSDMNENDYLSVAVARLAYEFVKEEHDLLLREIQKRGLTLTI